MSNRAGPSPDLVEPKFCILPACQSQKRILREFKSAVVLTRLGIKAELTTAGSALLHMVLAGAVLTCLK